MERKALSVAVAANAANPTVNTATVTGGGDPTCTNCSGTTTNPVIDAVNDTSTGQPGQAGTFNVSTNDKFPVGSTFTQTATTCVPAGTMTGAGVASFTYPGTTGASCTVTYSVCAPAPNTTICDTAILTVTAGKPITMAIQAMFSFQTDIGMVMAMTCLSLLPGVAMIWFVRNHLARGFSLRA